MAKAQEYIIQKVTASFGYDKETGKQNKKTESVSVPIKIFNDEKKCKAFIEKERERIKEILKAELDRAKDDITFRKYAEKVAERKRSQGDVRSITEQSNSSITEYLNTIVGDIKVKNINKSTVDKVKTAINNKPSDRGGIISSKTKYNYFSHFRSIINAAMDDNYFDENPIKKVKNFTFEIADTSYLEKEDLVSVMNSLGKFHIKTQVEVLLELFTGTRRGEVLSLRWPDINVDHRGKRYFDLREGFYYTKECGYFRGNLKTKKSKRMLPIHAFLFNKLEEYRIWQEEEKKKLGDDWKGTDYIICKDNGGNYNPDYFTQKVRKIFERMGFNDITTHSLRRSFATLADTENETTSSISNLLGDANVIVAHDHYIRRSKGVSDVSFLDSISNIEEARKTPQKSFKRLKKKEYVR